VATIDFPNPNDLTTFKVFITPDTGYWNGATYEFQLDIPALYVSEGAFVVLCLLFDVMNHICIYLFIYSVIHCTFMFLIHLLYKTHNASGSIRIYYSLMNHPR
jgi:hypothetical protein